MGASVAGPIERQLSTIAGITSMTSTSSLGLTTIIIQFDLNRNIDGAALDVQTALTVAARRLPIEMTIPPYFRKVNPADFPILLFSLVSPTLPLSEVDDYAEITLAQQISQLPGHRPGAGVRRAEIRRPRPGRSGSPPRRAASRSTTSATWSPRPIRTRRSAPSPGAPRTPRSRASAAMRHADEYKRRRRRLSQRRCRSSSAKSPRSSTASRTTWSPTCYNNERSIVLAIFKQPDANTVKIVDAIRERLPIYRAQIPASVKMEILADRSMSIREAVEDVQVTLADRHRAGGAGDLPVPALGGRRPSFRRSRCRSRSSPPARRCTRSASPSTT